MFYFFPYFLFLICLNVSNMNHFFILCNCSILNCQLILVVNINLRDYQFEIQRLTSIIFTTYDRINKRRHSNYESAKDSPDSPIISLRFEILYCILSYNIYNSFLLLPLHFFFLCFICQFF